MKIVSRNKHSLFSTKEQVGQDGTVTEVICIEVTAYYRNELPHSFKAVIRF